jgi:hypothetical protein
MQRRGLESTERPAGAWPLMNRRAPACALLGASLLLCLLLGAAIAAPALAAPAWLAPVNLSAAGQNGSAPQVAVDTGGDAVAVWTRYNGANYIIQAASRPAGGSWQAPVDLSLAGQNAFNPQLAVDPGGDAVAVWELYDGANDIVQAASRTAGGGWQAPVDLSVAGHSAELPQVAVDPSGDAVAVWYRSDGANDIVQAASRAAGGGWQAPVDLSAAGQGASGAQVAFDQGGDAVVVWQRYNGANFIVQAASRAAGGGWQTPVDLSLAGQSALGPQVAVDPGGDAVVVWQRSNGAKYIVQAASRAAGGAWQEPVDLSVAGQNALVPQVAVDPGGDAVVVWLRYNGAKYIVQAASRAAGGWQTPVDLSLAGQSAELPQVAVDPAGDAVAVWERYNGANEIVQTSSRAAGGGWQTPVDLSVAGQEASEPQVTVDPGGDAVAVWYRSNGTNFIVQGAGYDAAGPQLRSLSIPAAGVVGRPLSFSVSPFDVWSALGPISWSFGDGTSAQGASVSHTYGTAGTYTVTVSDSDVLGNAGTAAGQVAISAAPAGSPKRIGRAKAKRILKVKGGKALLALSCPAGADCAGVAKLLVTPAAGTVRASRKRRPKTVTIGKAAFGIAAGKSKTVKVALSGKGKAMVGGAGRTGLRARLGGSGVIGRAVVLKPAGYRARYHRKA